MQDLQTADGIDAALLGWDGELLITRHDHRTGAWLFVAVHSTAAGPAAGGTRAMEYPSLRHAAEDACRLAESMTLKMAVNGLPMGGGKSVIALPTPRAAVPAADWAHLLSVHADTLRTLRGSYWTGPDVNTGSADMDALRRQTEYVFGGSSAGDGPGSGAFSTGLGVVAGIRASARQAGLPADLAGVSVHVQGCGSVGRIVTEQCAQAGARVLVTDLDPSRLAGLPDGAQATDADDTRLARCDVWAPCGPGGVVTARNAPTLEVKVVAGAANNPLADRALADVLRQRGVVYAPDFVINSGGAIYFIGREVLDWSAVDVADRVQRIEQTLSEVYLTAGRTGVSTETAALQLARQRAGGGTGPATDQLREADAAPPTRPRLLL